MGLPRFQYYEPTELAEACRMLQTFGDRAALLAGGSDLLVKMKKRELQPTNIISLVEIEEMKKIDFNGRSKTIGSCCTISRIAESKEIRCVFPALASAAGHVGSPAVRNLGTIGGNIVTASPAADLPPALTAYGARVRLVKEDHERFLPLEQVFRGPGVTHIGSDEILADLYLEAPPDFSGVGFFKLGNRKALQISIVNGACFLALNPRSGEIEKARVVLGAVGPTLVRAHFAENILMGEKPDESVFLEAGRAAARDCSPIDDLRASAAYRRDMIRVLTTRSLHAALEESRKTFTRT